MIWTVITDEETDQTDNGVPSNLLVGTAEQITDRLKAYKEAGLTMPLIWPPFTDVPVSKTLDDLKRIKERDHAEGQRGVVPRLLTFRPDPRAPVGTVRRARGVAGSLAGMVRFPDVRGRALAALCVTEIVSWGTLYYAFPVLLGPISADTGWSATATVGAFSTGAVVSAGTGIVVGRLIDAHGPRPVMTTGSVLGVARAAGGGGRAVAAAGSTWRGRSAGWPRRRRSIRRRSPRSPAGTARRGCAPLTTVTLVAGFASTVFAPLTAALVGHLTWRGTYVVLAVVLGVVTVPVHLCLLTPPWRPRSGAAGVRPGRRSRRRSGRARWSARRGSCSSRS